MDVDLCAPVARIVEIEPDQGTAFVAHDEASGKNCRARCGVPFSRFRMRATASDLIVLSHRSLRPLFRFIWASRNAILAHRMCSPSLAHRIALCSAVRWFGPIQLKTSSSRSIACGLGAERFT